MSRLTKKSINGYDLVENEKVYSICGMSLLKEAVHKLGKLEDLEDELGCSLEVMFKALKEGIRINKTLYVPIGLEYSGWVYSRDKDEREFIIQYESDNDVVKPKDYQKTWRLRGEK